MRIMELGRALFAAGIIGVGVLFLIYGNSTLTLKSMPHWVPGRGVWLAWIYASGVVMLGCGISLFFTRTMAVASRILLVYLLVWLLWLRVPFLVKGPWVIGYWENFAEGATLVSGAWVIFASLVVQEHRAWLRFAVGESGVRLARILFGIALFLFGLAHFGYLKYTASLVPAWLPWHIGWACLTGAGYMVAGLGTLFRIYPRLAATLTTGMMALFQILIWIPKVIAMPNHGNWSEFLIGWALVFGAWVVADSYRGVAWLSIGKLSRAEVPPENQTFA